MVTVNIAAIHCTIDIYNTRQSIQSYMCITDIRNTPIPQASVTRSSNSNQQCKHHSSRAEPLSEGSISFSLLFKPFLVVQARLPCPVIQQCSVTLALVTASLMPTSCIHNAVRNANMKEITKWDAYCCIFDDQIQHADANHGGPSCKSDKAEWTSYLFSALEATV
jgi:hypothetical protein